MLVSIRIYIPSCLIYEYQSVQIWSNTLTLTTGTVNSEVLVIAFVTIVNAIAFMYMKQP